MKSEKFIASHLEPGTNGFGLLRLFAAIAVVYSHAWGIVGGNEAFEPLEAQTGFSLGWHAVNLFFALSGILIAESLSRRSSYFAFGWARILRIYPALIVVTAGVYLIALTLTGAVDWRLSDSFMYVVRNAMLVGGGVTLPGVFADNPIPGEINTPLWTIKFEVMAYASVAALCFLSQMTSNRLSLKSFSLAIVIVTGLVMMTFDREEMHSYFGHALRFAFTFYLGVLAWSFKDQIRPRLITLALIFSVNVFLLANNVGFAPAQIILVAYGALYLGTLGTNALTRFTDRQDYSYGVYIIGFPVQQTVMLVSGITDPLMNFFVSILIALPLAAVCWNFIEKPALKFKKYRLHTSNLTEKRSWFLKSNV
ncbi:MAG: acyltransferase [Pseudomonadota bacterium]